jgi:hypothetical protein
VADDRNPSDPRLLWSVAGSLMTTVGMVMVIVAKIMEAGGWSTLLLVPIFLASAALTVAAVTIRSMRAGRHPTNTQRPPE